MLASRSAVVFFFCAFDMVKRGVGPTRTLISRIGKVKRRERERERERRKRVKKKRKEREI